MMKLKKGFAVAMAAGVLTTGGLGVQASVFSATAFAQGEKEDTLPGPGGSDTQSSAAKSVAVADVKKMPETATLVIHKLANDHATEDGQLAHDGTEQTGVQGTPLDGAKFSVQQINGVDLKTNAGWVEAEGLAKNFDPKNPDTSLGGKKLGTATTVTTTGGEAKAEDLPAGLYLVKETEAPTGYELSVAPFVVALPMTNPANRTEWLNEVHVYPKDQKEETAGTKTVKDESAEAGKALTVGDTVDYQIEQKLTSGARYDAMVLSDFYSDRLDDTNTTPVVKLHSVDGDETLVDGTDYDLTKDTAKKKFVVTFKAAGLKKVSDIRAKGEAKVTVDLSFVVKANTGKGEEGPIVNSFKTWTHREKTPPTDETTPPPVYTTPPTPGTPEDPNTPPENPNDNPNFPKSFYGHVNVDKFAADGTTELSGAEFNVYECNDQSVLQGKSIAAFTPDNTDKPEVDLLVNDYRDGKKVTTPGYYCLVETKAPDGYELLAKPIKFQVLTDNADAPTKVALVDQDVKDTKDNGGFELPLTGGKGVFALLLAGAAFLVLGRGYSMYAGRRNKA